MIRMELIRMVKKGKKHVWNKFYLQVCFSIIILMSEMIMYGTERNGSDKRKNMYSIEYVKVYFCIIILTK
jgi:hypothetical protein